MDFHAILNAASNGLNLHDLGTFGIRVATGSFFFLSGANKLFNKGRHAGLVKTLVADHVPAVPFMQWWVPGWEFIGGAMLALGILSAFAASVLSIILLVACCAEGRARVASYAPINRADYIDDWLYLPEVIYLLPLATIILAGGGKFALL
jgi:putative oxidoreductase